MARRKLLTRERTARAQAEEANRAKDDFLATLSHELRTPLNAMVGWVNLLQSGKLDSTTAKRGLDAIDRNTRIQAQLIEDLLDVSRIITGKLTLEVESVHLPAVVVAALDSIRPAANAKGIRLVEYLEPTLPVSGDRHRLQQVIWNLLSNAVKFTNSGGTVTVSLREYKTIEDQFAQLNLNSPDRTQVHVLQQGETLSSVAGEHYDLPGEWRVIAQNR